MKRRFKTAIALLLSIAVVANINMPVKAESEELDKATGCTFVLPAGYVLSESEDNVFVNSNYPLESGIITYSVVTTGSEDTLTNAERAEAAESTETEAEDASTELTQEFYQETMSEALNEEYGTDVGYTISEFNNISIDGYPGYFIASTYQGEQTIHQMVYIVLSRYKTFTITYSRAEDDDTAEAFEASAATIHVYN